MWVCLSRRHPFSPPNRRKKMHRGKKKKKPKLPIRTCELIHLHCPSKLCMLGPRKPARRHQAHSKSRTNYGQMRGSSLCLRTKPEVTQLVFKGSSPSRGSGERPGVWEEGGRPAGYKYLFGQLLEGTFAVCLSSTHPGGGPGDCKTGRGK